jgi:hypothetical protein
MGSQGRKKETQFVKYMRLLYVHDMVSYPGFQDFITDDEFASAGIFASLAIDFILDDQERPIPGVPRGLDLSLIGNEAIYHCKDTSTWVLFAMALDITLQKHAQHHGTDTGTLFS